MNKSERNKIFQALFFPLLITIACWAIWWIDKTEKLDLYQYGIFPREFFGLRGILFAPLLHSTDDYAHIVNNSFPLLVLGWALFYFYDEIASRILILIWLLTGLWVWIGANQAYHIGMSGVLYGLVTFLFYSGIMRRNRNLLGLTLLITFLYGGMVWGILPYDISISWESHLFGAIAGVVLAWYFRKKGPQPDHKEWPEETEPPFLLREDGTKDYDFWKTEEQRKKEEGISSPADVTDDQNDEGKNDGGNTKINYIYKKNDK